MGVGFETGGGLLLAEEPGQINERPEFPELSRRNTVAFSIARSLVSLPGGGADSLSDEGYEGAGCGMEWSPWIVTDPYYGLKFGGSRKDDRPLPKVVQVQIFSSIHDLEADITEQRVQIAELLATPKEAAEYSGRSEAPLLVPQTVNRISDRTGPKVLVQGGEVISDETKQVIFSEQKLTDKLNPLSALIRHLQRCRMRPVVSDFERRMMEIRAAAHDASRNPILAAHLISTQ